MGSLSPIRTVLLFIAVACLSVVAVPRLSVDLLPKDHSTQFIVSFSVANATPDVVEQQATSLLEGVLAQLSQLKSINSVSSYNEGRITLLFDRKVDMELKQFEVNALIRQVFPSLPPGVSYPEVQRSGGGENAAIRQSPLLVYTIEGPAAAFQIKKIAEETFRKALAEVKGLREVQISGTEDIQLRINFYPERLRAYGISPQQIESTLQEHFATTYPGAVRTKQGEEYFLALKGRPYVVVPPSGRPPRVAPTEIESIHLQGKNGTSIPLKALAEVYLEEQEPQQFFRINGKNSVNLSLFSRSTENSIVLAQTLKSLVPQIAQRLPTGYRARLDYDNTEYLANELQKTQRRTALSMAILSLFVLLAYRNWRHLLILLSALLINLALTILAVWVLSVEIHLYTLAGLAIAFGIMIDNAIVMLDYYRQNHQRGVIIPLLGATLTTAAALLLVFLLPAEDRQNLSDFCIVICLALGTSLVTAFGFIPGMVELVGAPLAGAQSHSNLGGKGLLQAQDAAGTEQPRGGWRSATSRAKNEPHSATRKGRRNVAFFRGYYRLIEFCARYRTAFLTLWLLAFGLPVFLLPSKWEGQEWYNQTIGSDTYQEDIRPWVDQLLGGALRLFVRDVYERYSYRDPERTRLYVSAELPSGNTPAQMNYLLERMEDYLAGVKGLEKYVTNVYSGEYGEIEITFEKAYEKAALPFQLKSRLVALSLDWSGVQWSVYGVGQGFSNASGEGTPSFRVKLLGYNYDELERQALRLKTLLEQHPRVQKVNIDALLSWEEKATYAYHLKLDAARLAQAGALRSELTNALREQTLPANPGFEIPLNIRSTDEAAPLSVQLVPVLLSAQHAVNFSTYELLRSSLSLDSTRRLRLQNLAELSWEKGSSSIHREDRRYVRALSFDYVGSPSFGIKHLNEQLEVLRPSLPAGYEAKVEAYRWDTAKTTRQYGLILLLLLSNYIICAVLFESLRLPLAVVLVIPLSLIGLFLTFAWGDFYFDQGGYAAIVLLGGMVVNAAIFIISDYRQMATRMRHANRTLLKATVRRARTILLTVVSTICGLIPFMLEGDTEVFWFALAIGSAGGLLFSLLVVFWVLPVMLWKRVKKLKG
ncbi:efflux RND transporter permease subunit [Haliscomenobacter sp.]|uniref:efflux RND transporter permease subunit n=1 Tax=Haliscomenobacter sp. TaxID=2717303 RepID=UPI0033651C60